VLVDRGWIPQEDAAPEHWAQYDEGGEVTITGILRRPQSAPDLGGVPDPTLAPGETRLDTWNIVNLERIKQQVGIPLLDVYIQEAPDEAEELPYASLPEVELTEGPHQGYAAQWFIFAAILAFGYPIYVRRQTLQEA
jgi:surfeit locus 1 family protein